MSEKITAIWMCTVGNFSKQLVQCFLVLRSCSWLRRYRSVCWHCDSRDSLPGHFRSGGPVCVSQESSWLWVWYYWLLGTQWRLSAREHQGSETRSVNIVLHTCDLCGPPCVASNQCHSAHVAQLEHKLHEDVDWGLFYPLFCWLHSYNQPEVARCTNHFFSIGFSHTFKLPL